MFLSVWPHRLTVRTPGSHPDNRGSIPREVTKLKPPPQRGVFSFINPKHYLLHGEYCFIPTMNTFNIVRHGETENNRAKRISGWIDTPLSTYYIKLIYTWEHD